MDWLPGMDSNHEETSAFSISNLLILKSATPPKSRESRLIRTVFVQRQNRSVHERDGAALAILPAARSSIENPRSAAEIVSAAYSDSTAAPHEYFDHTGFLILGQDRVSATNR
jgi:hypothetical protein